MPRIHTQAFSGMVPKRAAHLLPDNAATLAENCKLTDGQLRAYSAPAPVTNLPQPAASIYLYRDGDPRTNYWFNFDRDVDVVPSPIADDANNRVYMTNHINGARWTDNILALTGGTDYPVNTLQLGMPEPEAPVLLVEGLPDGINAQGLESGLSEYDDAAADFVYYATDTFLYFTKLSADSGDWSEGQDREAEFFVETRFYVTTWVTEDGKEGPPSLPSGYADWRTGQSAQLTVDSGPGAIDLNITHFRVYVTRGDGYWWLCDQMQYGTGDDQEIVTDVPIGQTEVVDVTPVADRREQLVTTNWLAPPTDLKGITLLPGGVAVGYKGKELFFSVPYVLYAWPPQFRLTLEFEIVALAVAGNSVIITTTGNPYICFGTDPSAMTLERIDASQTCTSKRSLVDMGYQAIYASPDGLCAIAGGQPQLITEQIINREDWRSRYHPEQIQGYYHDGKYYGFHGDGGFLFDPAIGSLVDLTLTPDCAFADLETDTLYLATDTEITSWDRGAALIPYRWRSKEWHARRILVSSCRIVAESYTNLNFSLICDGQVVLDMPVTSRTAFRLPAGDTSCLQYELRGTDTIRSVTLATSMGEL